jgi:hypothetical protein
LLDQHWKMYSGSRANPNSVIDLDDSKARVQDALDDYYATRGPENRVIKLETVARVSHRIGSTFNYGNSYLGSIRGACERGINDSRQEHYHPEQVSDNLRNFHRQTYSTSRL